MAEYFYARDGDFRVYCFYFNISGRICGVSFENYDGKTDYILFSELLECIIFLNNVRDHTTNFYRTVFPK